jgi:release factor glutamine methyltransferase
MRLADALREATLRLAPVSDTPRLDAELLMAHALGEPRETMLLTLSERKMPAAFDPLLTRRLAHEPLAYIIGTRHFWTISLKVTPAVLIPRPDSETLIEAAIAYFGSAGPKRVLDLGTGSGALLLAVLAQWPEATGLGVDSSEGALVIARQNARAIAPGRAEMRLCDWADGIGEQFDLILCNPPYVETGAVLSPDVLKEPHAALFSGSHGLDDYRRLIPQLPAVMARGGIACLEIGHAQAEAVKEIAEPCGLEFVLRRDLAGRDRCLVFSAGGQA